MLGQPMDATQSRREFKFLLPAEVAEAVRAEVAGHYGGDGHAVADYHITSDYFDSEDHASYWEKVLGYHNRERVRTRTYRDHGGGRPPVSFIEIKHRARDLTTKLRMPLDEDELAATLRGEIPDFEGREGGPRFRISLMHVIESPRWEPLMRIGYRRKAYDHADGGRLRITFDSEVRCALPDYASAADVRPDLKVLDEGAQVMEVKSIGPVPYWFRDLLGRFSIAPGSLSKYTIAMERHHFGDSSPARNPSTCKNSSIA